MRIVFELKIKVMRSANANNTPKEKLLLSKITFD